MKRILLMMILVSVQHVHAQDNVIDKFYKEYRQKNGLYGVIVSGKMLNVLIENKNPKEQKELGAIINKITGLKMLAKNNPKDGNELFLSADALIPKQYSPVLSIDETGRKVKCYTLESGDKTTELVMVAWQWGRFMVLSITGDIELKEIYKLTQNLNFEGLGLKVNSLR